MATSGYVGEIQPAVQPQGAGVTVTPGQPDASSTPSTAPQFLAEIQTTVVTPTIVTPTGQAAAADKGSSITNQKASAGSQPQSAASTQPAQTQYVTAEIQSSPTQSGNPQSAPQYIVVTVTGTSRNMQRELVTAFHPDGKMHFWITVSSLNYVEKKTPAC